MKTTSKNFLDDVQDPLLREQLEFIIDIEGKKDLSEVSAFFHFEGGIF